MRLATRLVPAILAALAACGSDPAPDTRPGGALPRSFNLDGVYSVRLEYHRGPPCGGASSVAATGPGPAPEFAATTVALACASGTWMGELVLGSAPPDEVPTPYDFTVTEGGAARTERGSVPCYLEDLPVPLEPAFGSTTSPVTFRWLRTGDLAADGYEFAVYVHGAQPTAQKSVVDASSLSLALPPIPYPGWSVEAIGVGGYEPASPVRCAARATGGGSFRVVPP